MDNLFYFLISPVHHRSAGIFGRIMDGIRLRDGILNDVWFSIVGGSGITSVPEFAAPDNNLRRRSRVRCFSLAR